MGETNGNGNGFSSRAQLVFGAITVLIALGSGFIGAYISPMNQRISENGLQIERMQSRQGESEKESIAQREKLKEIDTQIFWSTDIENIHKRHVLQLMGIVWKKVFDTDLPMPSSLNDGPSKVPR